MQISRHWRLNSQRYRLEGFRNSNGEVSLQNRPSFGTNKPEDEPVAVTTQENPETTLEALPPVDLTCLREKN